MDNVTPQVVRDEHDAEPGETPAGDAHGVGQEVRDLRKVKGMTIPQLAEVSGLSTGFISQMERGLSSPSVDALRKIAKALDVSISWFFRNDEAVDKTERNYVVRSQQRRALKYEAGIRDELLSPHLRGQLELLHCRFPPGSSSGEETYSHKGEEAGVVLQGQFELQIGDRTFLLNAGDSFGFPSTTPHRYRNPGTSETIVIWAVTPPSY
ncbi:MAG: XRE family transcriptional regulator [Pseudomonadota bacterium]